jgi:hypothetical protein
MMGITQYHKKEQNMTQLGTVVRSEKPQTNERSSLTEVKEPNATESCQHDANDSIQVDDEETTELRDDATREPKTVKIGVIEEPNEGRNAKEPVED